MVEVHKIVLLCRHRNFLKHVEYYAFRYTAESGEMKSRRLADLAYQFGLYAFAHSQYRAVKKDFENDQAWIYHATALVSFIFIVHISSTIGNVSSCIEIISA